MDNLVDAIRAIRFGGRFRINRFLAKGSFGRVYLGEDDLSDERIVIKLEHHTVAPSLLENELHLYVALKRHHGFAKGYWFGERDDYRVLVMQALGPSLEDLRMYCGGTLSLKTTLMVFLQLLRRYETFHSIGQIHCDVKPENFLVGTGHKGNTVYMIDFGLACAYRREREGKAALKQTPDNSGYLQGTCRYASINTHLGINPSPRDDLEALGYVMVELLKGSLPWTGIKKRGRDKYRAVLRKKQMITVGELCEGIPAPFITYFNYVRGLTAVDVPDYSYLRGLMGQLFREKKFDADNIFDWTIIEYYRLKALKEAKAEAKKQSKKEADQEASKVTPGEADEGAGEVVDGKPKAVNDKAVNDDADGDVDAKARALNDEADENANDKVHDDTNESSDHGANEKSNDEAIDETIEEPDEADDEADDEESDRKAKSEVNEPLEDRWELDEKPRRGSF